MLNPKTSHIQNLSRVHNKGKERHVQDGPTVDGDANNSATDMHVHCRVDS
jgi:hypothetical protein